MSGSRMRLLIVLLVATLAIAVAGRAPGQTPSIRIGFPMTTTGPGAVFGKPALQGAEMAVDEINARGGVLGRRLELVHRDTKLNPEEATKMARELIVSEKVNFLVGGLSASEGLAISEVARQEKALYVAPISKSTAMTAEKFHKYVFQTAANTNTEARSAAIMAAEIMAKKNLKRLATILPDYEYGQKLNEAFVPHIKKLRPDVEIVGQIWTKIVEKDYTPFITQLLQAKPEIVFGAVWGGPFPTFAKQAKPFGFFEKVVYVGAGEVGSPEVGITTGEDMPEGIAVDAYDQFYHPETPAHRQYTEALRKRTGEKYPPSWAITGYVAVHFLAEAVRKAGTTDTDAVIKALEGLTIETPIGSQTIRAKDHRANRGQFWGITKNVAEYPFKIMQPVRYIRADEIMD